MQNEEAVHARGAALRARTEGRSTGSVQVSRTSRREMLERAEVLPAACVALRYVAAMADQVLGTCPTINHLPGSYGIHAMLLGCCQKKSSALDVKVVYSLR